MAYIRVGDHELEVSAPVQVLALKTGMKIMLPDGAPPLPADLFDTTTPPDGRLGYVCKTKDKVIVIFSTRAKASLIPVQFAQIIEPVGDVPQTHVGTLSNGDVLMSIPYRYKRPIRMTADLSISGLFGTSMLAKKDEVGFDAGEFRGGSGTHRLLCFFNTSHGESYRSPDCFVKFPSPDGSFGLARVMVLSNLPTSFQMSRYQASGVTAPSVETENVAIDHDFHLDLLVGAWSDRGLDLSWRSEGIRLETITVRPAADGTVKYHIKGGTLTLRCDLNTGDKTKVEFEPDPTPSMAGQPPTSDVATAKP